MLHACIGANVLDRLVKCPGSLRPGKGSLVEHRKNQEKHKSYTKNNIECNGATTFGEIVDELAKSYIYFARTGGSKKSHYVKPEHECDPKYFEPAKKYADHILKVAKRFDNIFIDPRYDMSKYMKNLPDCEFSVSMNPDTVLMNSDRSGLAFMSELSTARSYDRNKMFQVLCGAIGLIEYFPNITDVICEVYNTSTEEVQYSKFSKEELEAYRDDLIVPTLQKVRNALEDSRDSIEDHRQYNSWCSKYCVFGPKEENTCKVCHCGGKMVENEVPVHVHFFLDLRNEADIAAYNNLFTK
jgi:hypothetical protein